MKMTSARSHLLITLTATCFPSLEEIYTSMSAQSSYGPSVLLKCAHWPLELVVPQYNLYTLLSNCLTTFCSVCDYFKLIISTYST